MVEFPWSRGAADGSSGGDEDHPEALVACAFQDGTLAVYADRVVIERVDRSRFDDKTIPMGEIEGVDLENGITIGYLQIEQTGVPVDSGGLFSDPVNENTLHFGRGSRDCASEARTEILAHAEG
ncbi:hypothetical protein [Halobellus rubicundus]|uniref:Uncharacterized protein n=1 Tax=Halobellus rubicundus TaxID=2996466 RepID=A0ABD5MHE7_9EURY